MRRLPKVGVDFDDTLVPFTAYACALCNLEHGTEYTIEDIDRWGMHGTPAIEAVSKYYTSETVLHMQRVSEEAKLFIHELSQIAEVYCITAVTPQYMGIRARQILEAFPEIDANHIICGSAKNLVQGIDILLDDGPHNILESAVPYPVLMRRPWNRHLSGVLSVNNFGEFLTLVKQILRVEEDDTEIDEPCVYALVGPSGSKKHELAQRLDQEGRAKVVSTEDSGISDYITRCFYAGKEYRLSRALVDRNLSMGHNVVVPVDICGALALKMKYPTKIVFCRQSRESMIRDTLSKGLPLEETTMRLLSMEQELRNERLCDVSVRTDLLDEAVRLL